MGLKALLFALGGLLLLIVAGVVFFGLTIPPRLLFQADEVLR